MKQSNILIVGRSPDTINYESALHQMGASFLTTLDSACFPYFDGLLLPGGGDIDPSLFGEQNRGSKNIDKELDTIQLQALDFFIQTKKPVLGICKGMQIINVGLGGTIIQDMGDIKNRQDGSSIQKINDLSNIEAVFNPQDILERHAWNQEDRVHPTHLITDSFLSCLYQTDSLITNSAHHQSIGKLGRGLQIIQWADDGIPEGIVHSSLPLFGVQWHPERQFPKYRKKDKDLADGRLVFSYFVNLCC
ncbi:MAG: gamma-glutamyl-gamma-aminobutyrate hydrolase family protein [Lachnospiraceae bacterium]|nr:gamma-glutamyl-gamma-aminobutyrate hydrolase family protein [Lachnospiraceae bacterium]